MPRTVDSSVFEDAPTSLGFPAESTMAFEGSRVRYWTYGRNHPAQTDERPTIVMVHGFRGDHHGLAIIADALASRWNVVVPDLPGFGRSEPLLEREHSADSYAEVICALIHRLGSGPVALVGHSFGSVIAARTAARHPRDVVSLALINPICEPALDSSARLATLAASAFYRTCAALPSVPGNALVRSSWVTRISSEIMMKNRRPELRRFINGQHDAYFGSFASRAVVLESYESSIRDTVREVAGEVRSPTSLIVAERDDLGSVPAQQRLAEKFPDARLEVIPQVGHLIHYETPRRAAKLVSSFVEAHGAAPAVSRATAR